MKKLILLCICVLFMKSTICDAATATISGPSLFCAGDNVTLTASLSGCSGCTITNYQWKKWGVNIGTNSSTYNISSFSISDTGRYTVVITFTGGSGSPVTSSPYNISLTPNNTVTLSSAPGTDNQTVCINTSITQITYTTTGATGIGTASGLPAGVTAQWSSNTITITGTPTSSGTFNYSIPLTGGCGSTNASGTIQVNALNTTTVASSTPTLCNNTTISPNITHTTTGATGIGTASGLPVGVSAQWASNTITISGVPTNSGNYNYSIPLTGGCGNINATGTIDVIADNTVTVAPSTPTLCINTAISPNITHKTTGASGIGIASGLPAGVTAQWANDTITISGIPTVTGTFNYSIPLTGGCGSVNATGSIIVAPLQTLSWNSGSGTQNQSLCAGAAIIPIAFNYGGSANAVIVTTNPSGSLSYAVDTSLKKVTIFGNPDTSLTYTVTTSGSFCNPESSGGTISVPNQAGLNDIVAKTNQTGEPYLLIYPNPSSDNMYYQWYENGTPIDGANEQFFYPPRYNQTLHPLSCYKVFVISGSYYNCGNFTNCYIMPSGKSLLMNIYPNPGDGNFHLEFNSDLNVTGSQLTLYNLEGKIVYVKTIDNNEEVEIKTTLIQGFYFVELITLNGDKFIEKLAIR